MGGKAYFVNGMAGLARTLVLPEATLSIPVIAWRCEVGSVVGEDSMDPVRDSGDQAAQEVPRGAARHLLMQLDEGELRRSVDGDEQVELVGADSDEAARL